MSVCFPAQNLGCVTQRNSSFSEVSVRHTVYSIKKRSYDSYACVGIVAETERGFPIVFDRLNV